MLEFPPLAAPSIMVPSLAKDDSVSLLPSSNSNSNSISVDKVIPIVLPEGKEKRIVISKPAEEIPRAVEETKVEEVHACAVEESKVEEVLHACAVEESKLEEVVYAVEESKVEEVTVKASNPLLPQYYTDAAMYIFPTLMTHSWGLHHAEYIFPSRTFPLSAFIY